MASFVALDSITTWDELNRAFLAKFFYQARLKLEEPNHYVYSKGG